MATALNIQFLVICNFYFTTAASFDYTSITGEEITFTSGQTVNDVQCATVTVLDDSNVLENAESFQVIVSAMDMFVNVPLGQESIVININEDPQDG